ncbi:Glycosyltransferase RgtA/B/C/D-like domain-containing protein [Candidatus Magnetomoraceae bacterium gMMP-15]
MKKMVLKIYDSRFYLVILCCLYFCLFGVFVYLIDYNSKGQISDMLKKLAPLNLRVNFFLIITALVLCCKDISDFIKKFINKKGLILIALFMLALCMVFFATSRTHRIFYDEDIYCNVGQNIAVTNQTGYCNYGTFEYGEYNTHWLKYNKEPSGWPFLMSLIFQVFGTNEFYAFFLNNLLFSAGALIVFFISWHLTSTFSPSFIAALIFALIPHNLIWSNTAAAEPSTSFFAGLIVLAFIIFLKTGKSRHLFLTMVIIPLACQMRPESILIISWGILAILMLKPRVFADKNFWTFGLLTTLFLLPHFMHFYAMAGSSWGAKGAKFALEFFSKNLDVNGFYYLNNKEFPVLFTIFAVIGLFSTKFSIKWKVLILSWFLFFWGIFLFFYAGSYHYGADVRFALLSFMPLSILAGLGGGFIKDLFSRKPESETRKLNLNTEAFNTISSYPESEIQKLKLRTQNLSFILILLIIFNFINFLPQISRVGQEAWGARYDHFYAEKFIEKIPERSIILTHNPTMFLLWNRNAIQTHAGINHPGIISHLMEKYKGHVYFHYNYWCNTKSEPNIKLCQAIKNKYILEEIARAKEQDYEYVLYKMEIKPDD